MAYDEGSATVISIERRGSRGRQERRRADVRRALVDTIAWCQAGLEGSVSLESAVWEAGHALSPATREVLTASLA